MIEKDREKTGRRPGEDREKTGRKGMYGEVQKILSISCLFKFFKWAGNLFIFNCYANFNL